MADFNEPLLKRKIELFPKYEQLAFAILLCERMIPALDEFARDTGFNGSVYRKCLDLAWTLLEQSSNFPSCGELVEKCLDNAPDTEVSNHPLISPALNAALAVAATMNFVEDGNVSRIVEAAGLARDTAALFAQSIDASPPRSLTFREVMKHPTVQRELLQQVKDMKFLETLPLQLSRNTTLLIKEFAARTPPLLLPDKGH